MSAFDKVIGYETIKNELFQLCDMLRHREAYDRLGARLPKGALLYGEPGLGKTLMAKSFMEECGVPAYVIRRNKGSNDFLSEIAEKFERAKENAPAIVFLDDMDKFANEDRALCDTEEYVAVQAGIDAVKNHEVFVLATANDIDKLPDSLVRAGRFDRKIEFRRPTLEDAEAIIAYYFSDKKVSPQVDREDLAKMISYSSCAELETILNEAAILAAFEKKESIEMADLVKAVLRMQYDSPDEMSRTTEEERQKVALHEAGHLVACEVLDRESVGMASLRTTGHSAVGGFIRRCKRAKRRPHIAIVALAGKAAVEMYHAETCASGCQDDIERAYEAIRDGIAESGTHGFGMVDVSSSCFTDGSESMNSRNEAVTQAALERYMFKTRDILLKNREFLERTKEALLEKETLLYSDIREIRESVEIVDVAV